MSDISARSTIKGEEEVRTVRYEYRDIVELRRRLFLPLILAIVGTIAFISLFGMLDYTVKGLEFRVSARFGEGGYTILNIPLIGSVRAKTHVLPVELSLELRNIDLEVLKEIGEGEQTTSDFLRLLKSEVRTISRLFVIKLLGLGLVGGLAGVFVVERRRLSFLIGGALLGLAFVTSLFLGVYLTYDMNSFMNPAYSGLIEAAPWIMSGLEERFIRVNTLGAKLQVLADNLYRLFENIDDLEALGTADGEVKILHVSDIHNNPAAFELMEKVVSTFGVTAIIDTGDITDFGTGFEIDLAMKIRKLGIPYIFVPGNHESPVSLGKLSTFSNVKILSDEFYTIGGLEVLGIADPASRMADKINLSSEDIEGTVARIKELLGSRSRVPDILAVHNGRVATQFIGQVPVILHGHDHQLKVMEERGSVVVDAGTSGAAGIRGLQTPHGVPYTLALLHFARNNEEMGVSAVKVDSKTDKGGNGGGFRLIAVDTIKVNSFRSGFTLERFLIGR